MGKGLHLHVTPDQCRLLRDTSAKNAENAADLREQNMWLAIHRAARRAIQWFESDAAPDDKTKGGDA